LSQSTSAQATRFFRVKTAKIDRFDHIGICFDPGFTNFENLPSSQLGSALLQPVCYPVEKTRPLFC